VVLMDEPCSPFAPPAVGKIDELIDNLLGSYTVLIVTHAMQQAGRAT
jgi:phosphate transport system ATP-binding protein